MPLVPAARHASPSFGRVVNIGKKIPAFSYFIMTESANIPFRHCGIKVSRGAEFKLAGDLLYYSKSFLCIRGIARGRSWLTQLIQSMNITKNVNRAILPHFTNWKNLSKCRRQRPKQCFMLPIVIMKDGERSKIYSKLFSGFKKLRGLETALQCSILRFAMKKAKAVKRI